MDSQSLSQPDQVPAYIVQAESGKVAAGMENAAGQIIVPLLCVAQPLTPAVVNRQGLDAGDLFLHTEPNVPLLKFGEERRFVAGFQFTEFIEWYHRDSPIRGFRARSSDPKGDLAKICAEQWLKRKPGQQRVAYDANKSPEQQTHVDENIVFVLLFEGHLNEMIAMPLARTKHKKGKLLLSYAARRGNGSVPLYGGTYVMRTVTEKNAQGQTYFNFEFRNPGGQESWPTPDEYKAGEALYKVMKERYHKLALDDQQAAAEETAVAETKDF